MNRRESIRMLMAATGTLVALPAWANGWSRGDVLASSSNFSVLEEGVLAHVVDTIIPAGNAIGALSVGVDKFLVKLLDNCYEQDVRDNVKVQLSAIEASANKSFAKAFGSCDQVQRQELLMRLSNSTDKPEKDFFDLIKGETIRGFNTSKEVMLGYLKYKVVPGHYYGCVDVTT
ncbi:MAG TPA: gluconate 2-dehydrogenase subunit 3 family protein [Chryseolinea sp.]|nr:gluconate 2-dehydrogenase subunit 3 family protein [Chryseolinea sp.]